MTSDRGNLPVWRRPGTPVSSEGPLDRAEGPSTGSDLRAFGGILRRRKWTILATFLLVVVAVAAVTLAWPKTYVSEASILLDRPQGGGDIPGLSILERLDRARTLETEAELVRSRRVIGPVVDSLRLHVKVTVDGELISPEKVFTAFRATSETRSAEYRIVPDREGWRVVDIETDAAVARGAPGSEVEFDGITLTLPTRRTGEIRIDASRFPSAVGRLRQSIAVEPTSQDGDILEISCEAGHPNLAHRVCASVVAEYIDMRSHLQRSEAGVTAEFLRKQVASYASRLQAAEDSLQRYATENRGVALEEQATEEVRTLSQIRAQRDQLEARRRALSGLLSEGSRSYRDLAGFPAFLGNQTVSNLLTHLAELENRRSDLAQRRSTANPELAALDRRISDIESQLGSLARSHERSLESEIASLNRVLGSSSGRLSELPERQVDMARLEREVQSLSEIHGLLETGLREAEVAEAVREPNVLVVDRPTEPVTASSPKPLINMALAMALGLGLGLALAFVRELRDNRIHDRSDLQRRLDLPVLATIPHLRSVGPILPIAPAANGTDKGEATAVSRGRWSGLGWRRGDGEERAVALEAFRSLGTDLHLISRRLQSGDLRSIAVSSAGRGEGKTLVSSNLAIARASYGVHTLLIDADMRAGSVARFFELENESPGLSELLAGSASARETRRTIVVDGSDSLSIMPAGGRTADAAELLESSYFEAMLAGAQAVYDCVVVDTPPLGLLSDTSVIVQSVDAVILVVREDITELPALELALERLRRAGGPLVGVVYNDVALPWAYADGAYRDA